MYTHSAQIGTNRNRQNTLSLLSSDALMLYWFGVLQVLLYILPLYATYPQEAEQLLEDLLLVEEWNQKLYRTFPVYFDHLLQGGYFSMPSARMGQEGEMGLGYGWIRPYIHYNLRVQPFRFLEVSGAYRIFKGVPDPVLSPYGYGDYTDKGANLKLALFSPEESRYQLPGLAIGLEDFIGTSSFQAYYGVVTQILPRYGLEVSIGYGKKRIHRWFGGISWMPFWQQQNMYLQSLAFVGEYDAIPYQNSNLEKHPKGHYQKTPWNVGVKYRLCNRVDLSLSWIKGNALAFSLSSFYPFGTTKGFLPKLHDPLPYATSNHSPSFLFQEEDWRPFAETLETQGFEVLKIGISSPTTLVVHVHNKIYREQKIIQERLSSLLQQLIPPTFESVIVVFCTLGMPLQEYRYKTVFLQELQKKKISSYEISVMTPIKIISHQTWTKILFDRDITGINFELLPKTHTLFGSAKGKFKYALGCQGLFNGFLPGNLYYSIGLGWFFLSNLKHVQGVDRLNPSQLLQVQSNSIEYYKQRSLTLDEAYLEKNMNIGGGFYGRLGAGVFSQQYGGLGAECLYYPVNSSFAIGLEGAVLLQRRPYGIGFRRHIRQLKGFIPHARKFIGEQYFLHYYYDWKNLGMETALSAGKFLAKDWGCRVQASRYFPSGLRLGLWYTYTHAKDQINGRVYHDKGIFLSMPLDIFYTKSSRTRWNYALAAWLRDVGVRTYTGSSLYDLLNEERQ